ncbi:MAG: hypothetical protein JWM26_4479 [Betaproteobacteria bacterium]|nr:hypothetical protein [Betaproteobacteria bacterium]
MLWRFLKNAFGRRASPPEPPATNLLAHVRGVVHVGANMGQERDMYADYGLNVLWLEPIPEVFDILCANIRGYPRQRALRYLLTDRDDIEYAFHVASNDGQSSSILDFAKHRDLWPSIHYERTIPLKSITFRSLVERESIDLAEYDMLLMDTQGSELLVLKGAGELVRSFRFVQTEIADFEAYVGCCQLPEMEAYLGQHGYVEIGRTAASRVHPSGGRYYEIIYERQR